MKKIAVGDLGEFWYGDYKEPFEQLEGAVPGHPVGVLLKDDEGRIMCAYCGKTFDNLGRHVLERHGMPAKEYKSEVGLLQGSSLSSERLRIARIRQGQARQRQPGAADALIPYRANRRGKKHPALRTPERLNKTGRCYAQLLEVGRSILREEGRISQARMRKRGISEKSVLAFWDDFDEYRKALGDPYRMVRRWSDRALLDALGSLGRKIGRTPSESDLRRNGLPWFTTYQRRFGSWAQACEMAGLIPNLPTPLSGQLEVAFLTAYATTGRYKQAAKIAGISQGRGEEIMARYGAPFVVRNFGGTDTTTRRQWAADMARRLAGTREQAA